MGFLAEEAQLLSIRGGNNHGEARKWDIFDFLDQSIQVHVRGKTNTFFYSSSLIQIFKVKISIQIKSLNAFLTLMGNEAIKSTFTEANVIAEKLNELFL